MSASFDPPERSAGDAIIVLKGGGSLLSLSRSFPNLSDERKDFMENDASDYVPQHFPNRAESVPIASEQQVTLGSGVIPQNLIGSSFENQTHNEADSSKALDEQISKLYGPLWIPGPAPPAGPQGDSQLARPGSRPNKGKGKGMPGGPDLPRLPRLPEGLVQLLLVLAEPLDLAPLLRTTPQSPSSSAVAAPVPRQVRRQEHSFPLFTSKASRMHLRRKAQIAALFQPTYRLRPKAIANWRLVREVVKGVLAQGLQHFAYAEHGVNEACRILAASIVDRIKQMQLNRYRIAAMVRLAQKLNQGMTMQVSATWDAKVDRFSWVYMDTPTVSAQVIVFLVYKD